MSATPARPILRYHGGKWRLAEWIIGHFPAHRTYVEPFGGGGSVLLRKTRAYSEIYNELDPEIVNVFRVMRDPVAAAELKRVIELTPFARVEFCESYEPCSDPIEQARRTIVRAFMGFGSATASGAKSGFRANSSRSGTTPAHDWKHYPACVGALLERLRGVVIENKDALEVMLQHDGRETLHYVDPPYVLSTRSNANPYCKKGYRFEMTDEQHAALLCGLRKLEGMVVLSGYPCTLYDDALAGWTRVERPALADGARPRVEVLWINAAATSRASRGLMAFGSPA